MKKNFKFIIAGFILVAEFIIISFCYSAGKLVSIGENLSLTEAWGKVNLQSILDEKTNWRFWFIGLCGIITLLGIVGMKKKTGRVCFSLFGLFFPLILASQEKGFLLGYILSPALMPGIFKQLFSSSIDGEFFGDDELYIAALGVWIVVCFFSAIFSFIEKRSDPEESFSLNAKSQR